jgi:hypothetical protein
MSNVMRDCLAAVVLAAMMTPLAGCVERELKITSEPSGALVEVSGVTVGRTPVTIPFTWYGDYDIALRREGYQTCKTHADINPPWYEVPPLDLFSAVAPWTYHDQRYLHYKLQPQQPSSDAQLIERAEQMRRENIEPLED